MPDGAGPSSHRTAPQPPPRAPRPTPTAPPNASQPAPRAPPRASQHAPRPASSEPATNAARTEPAPEGGGRMWSYLTAGANASAGRDPNVPPLEGSDFWG